jgi:hypothetical protein
MTQTSLARIFSIDAIAIDALLLTTLQNPVMHKKLVKQRGQEAQYLLNLLQAVCRFAAKYLYCSLICPTRQRLGFPLDPSRERFHLGALMRLSRSSGLYPECMVLKGIELVGKTAIDFGGYGDIWQGLLGGKQIAVKVLKMLYKPDRVRFLQVGYLFTV